MLALPPAPPHAACDMMREDASAATTTTSPSSSSSSPSVVMISSSSSIESHGLWPTLVAEFMKSSVAGLGFVVDLAPLMLESDVPSSADVCETQSVCLERQEQEELDDFMVRAIEIGRAHV